MLGGVPAGQRLQVPTSALHPFAVGQYRKWAKEVDLMATEPHRVLALPSDHCKFMTVNQRFKEAA